MYHYGECSDYQNVVRKVRWNNDTMILFSKKKLFVRKFEKALCGAFSNKTCHILIYCFDSQSLSFSSSLKSSSVKRLV